MTDEAIHVGELQAGKHYRITLDDCCIQGEFEATFLRWKPSNDGSVEYDRAVFDNGVEIGPAWGEWEVELLEVKHNDLQSASDKSDERRDRPGSGARS